MDGTLGQIERYYIARTLTCNFACAIRRTKEALAQEGFGILTEIDVKETLRQKLGATFRDYRILGACNPPFALAALQAEDKIGLMLPCNVIVQDRGDGTVEVAAIDPLASMRAIENPSLNAIARDMRAKLQATIDRI